MTKIEFLKSQQRLTLDKVQNSTEAAVKQLGNQIKRISENVERFPEIDIRSDLAELISWCVNYKNEIDLGCNDAQKIKFAIEMCQEAD